MPLKLLLVEDSADDAALLLRVIQNSDYSVDYERVDTEKALCQSLEDNSWDLVITDHKMPGFSSAQVIAIVKKFDNDLPIIIVSGAMGEEEAVAAMRAGANDYLLKDNLKQLVPSMVREINESNIRKLHSKKVNSLMTAIDQSHNIIFVTDVHGRIESANRRFMEITGFSDDADVGQSVKIFNHEIEGGSLWNEQLENVVITKKNWIGDLLCQDRSGAYFWSLVTISPVFENGEVVSLVNIAEDFSKFKEHEIALSEKALHDPLTSLPNRFLFNDQLEQTIKIVVRNNSSAALLTLDLDNFKIINDTFGHLEGDNFLIEMARRLRNCIRESDSVARLGGDEFCILLRDVQNENDVDCIVQKIFHELEPPFLISGGSRQAHVSIGIAFISTDGLSSKEVRNNSDCAMYQAKNISRFNGENNYVYYNQYCPIDNAISAPS